MTADLKKRLVIFAVAVVGAFLFLLPTINRVLLSRFPNSWPSMVGESWISKPISLGLDLSGGVHLVYDVKVKEAVKSHLQATANSMRADLRNEKIAVVRAQATDANQLELIFLSDSAAERGKARIESQFSEASFVSKTEESGRFKLTYGITEGQAVKLQQNAVSQAIETLRNRVDQFGVAEPTIQKVGDTRILLQMPGVSDVEKVKKAIGSVAKLEFRLVPEGPSENTETLKNRDMSPAVVERETLMTGDAVADARVQMDQGAVEVSLRLTSFGSQTFKNITTEHVGRRLAIILDNVVYSAPEIKSPISGGQASISGGFTVEEARQLAVVLRAGALPAPLTVMEERTVGPTLGLESIKKGVLAIVIGFLAILAFMIVYYRKSGVVAVITLLLNVFFLLAGLSAFGATLTLPGLAGLALTIGVAVDSNVIIFERIRDELRVGATRDSAVSGGFGKAFSAIIDANLCTLFSALILYNFGTGPVRGFAVTLALGILTTLFCAVFVARLAFDYFPLRSAKDQLSI